MNSVNLQKQINAEKYNRHIFPFRLGFVQENSNCFRKGMLFLQFRKFFQKEI